MADDTGALFRSGIGMPDTPVEGQGYGLLILSKSCPMLHRVLAVARYLDGKFILSRGPFDRRPYTEMSAQGDDNY